MTIPEIPIPSGDRLMVAIREHNDTMEAEISSSRAEIASLHRQLDAAMNEAGLLREQLGEKTKSFEAVQSYATRLNTKLEMIVSVIGGAQAEAMRYGAKGLSATGKIEVDEKSVSLGAAEEGGISGMLKRLNEQDEKLPVNRLTN